MKHAVFFPIYNIYSDLVKTAIGVKDSRSVEQFFRDAGVAIHQVGKKKCVTCEDLLALTKPKPIVMHYQAKTEFSKKLDELE